MNASTYNHHGISLLQSGEISIIGSLLRGSNASFLSLVTSQDNSSSLIAVYKPSSGENPLWDFKANSLAHREVAAYLVSKVLDWHFVPPTVYREDAPYGAGSLQLFIKHHTQRNYFNLKEKVKPIIQKVVCFDLLINNADRKAGHFLLDKNNKIWLIDHGICFHTQWKLRTVVWDLAGHLFPKYLQEQMKQFSLSIEEHFADDLIFHLSEEEIVALRNRAQWLSQLKTFPYPPKHSIPFPYPLI